MPGELLPCRASAGDGPMDESRRHRANGLVLGAQEGMRCCFSSPTAADANLLTITWRNEHSKEARTNRILYKWYAMAAFVKSAAHRMSYRSVLEVAQMIMMQDAHAAMRAHMRLDDHIVYNGSLREKSTDEGPALVAESQSERDAVERLWPLFCADYYYLTSYYTTSYYLLLATYLLLTPHYFYLLLTT